MMIISFAWTTGVYLQGRKTVTRRFWDDGYCDRWFKSVKKDGWTFQAYDKNPRFGGHLIGFNKLLEQPFKQSLSMFTDADEKAEGGLWGNAANFIRMMGGADKIPWVIRFEKIGQVGRINEVREYAGSIWLVDFCNPFRFGMVKFLTGQLAGQLFPIHNEAGQALIDLVEIKTESRPQAGDTYHNF